MRRGPDRESNDEMNYTAYPFQVIDHPNGVILRRGNSRILLQGEDAIPTVLTILKETSGRSSTMEAIYNLFPPFRHVEIKSLLDELVHKRFLVDVNHISSENVFSENNTDVFFWQLKKKPSDLRAVLNEKSIFIFGQNKLSHLLKKSILDIGFKHVEVVPYGPLNAFPKTKEELLMQQPSFDDWKVQHDDLSNAIIIGASEFGGQFLLLELNEFCIRSGAHFMPLIIEDMRAYVGPLVIPSETACLQCLRSRQNAHLHNIDLERYTEQFAQEGQEVAATHISILKSASEMAAFELLRAYGNFIPNYKPSLINLNLLNAKMSENVVLKVPRCSICSTANTHPSILSTKPSP